MQRIESSGRRWRNHDLVRERDHHRGARWLRRLVLSIILIVVPATAYLLQKNAHLQLSYRVGELRAENELLLEQERRLTVLRANLESLESIERWALARHGLIRPSPSQVVVARVGSAPRGQLIADRRMNAPERWRRAGARLSDLPLEELGSAR